MEIKNRINNLRNLMKKYGINYYIVPSADYHQSEYVSEYFKCREWISGFTGSAGTVIIGLENAGLWTDGRYYIQAEKQLLDSGITLFKAGEPNVPTYLEYITDNMNAGEILGFDGKIIDTKTANFLKNELLKKQCNIKSDFDLIGELWENRPHLPKSKAFLLDTKYCGESLESKIERIRNYLLDKNCDGTIISSLDDIAWIFNLRGNDVACNPVNLAYAIISTDKVILYIDENKLDEDIELYLHNNNVEIRDYFDIYQDVENISSGYNFLINLQKVNFGIVSKLNKNITIIDGENPSTLFKACKNETEIENLRNCHIKDGVAVTKFMHWLKNSVGNISITEISATEKLEEFRKEQPLYIEPSFNTICAYEDNAAMMHYSATDISNKEIKKQNMLLVDSGGQYFDGTTDITRTFILGECPDEFKKHFTLVLKGMIGLSKIKFPYGITGTNLDVLARQHLWNLGIEYNCGTGHGVGFLLNVHEGPQSIRKQYNPQKLEIGMNITNEPGVYIEGSHGIRIENELVVKEYMTSEFGKFLEFETITYAPIDLDGIDVSLLTFEEKEFLNSYHKMVFDKLSPFLNDEIKEWLRIYTREI